MTAKGELGCPNCDGPCIGCWETNVTDKYDDQARAIVPCHCKIFGYEGRGRPAHDCPQHEYAEDIAAALRAAAAEEREACATVADEAACAANNHSWLACQRAISAKIRVRGTR